MAGIDAFGVQFQRGNGAAPVEVFTTIANVTSVGVPGMTRDTYDVTAHDSPNHRREHIGGLVDGDEITVSLNYDPEVHAVIRDDFDDIEPRNYRFVYPVQAGGGQDQMALILTGFSGEAPHDGQFTAEATFKITGDVTFVPLP